MIYILDTGFGYVRHPLATLVYGVPVDGTHGVNQLTVIKSINPTDQIHLCDIGADPSNKDIMNVLNFVNDTGTEGATICIAFSVHYNEEIDNLITSMADKFDILVAGGNAKQELKDLTPCSNVSVITVGSLNKSNERASHNSVGDLDLWAPGTNIDVDGVKISGSSIATAIATGYFSKHKSISETQAAIHKDFEYLITCKF